MAARPNTTPTDYTAGRLRWLRDQSKEIRQYREDAADSKSWQAASAFAREERALRDQIDAQLAEKALAEAPPAAELTREERAAALSGLVDGASDDELEVAVAEWLRRRRYRLAIHEGGTLALVPLGEELSGLRLVE